MTDTCIRVVIANSNELFRLGLSSLLQREPGIQVVGVASTAGETLLMIARQNLDVLLIESRMRDGNGLPTVTRVLALGVCDRVAVITMSDTDFCLQATLRLEVQGHIFKDSSFDELLHAVRSVVIGEPHYSRPVYKRMGHLAPVVGGSPSGHNGHNGHNVSHERGLFALSEREQGVLRLVAVGSTNQEIGVALGIATNTVKVHLRSILDKLHVRNRQQAAAYAVQEGLVSRVFA